MKTAARRSPIDRDRAITRLRALTIGSSIAGIAAVGGFGALAAASYDGNATGITTAAVTSGTTTTDGGTSNTATDNTTSTSTGTTTQATAAPTTTTTGAAHAATGSS